MRYREEEFYEEAVRHADAMLEFLGKSRATAPRAVKWELPTELNTEAVREALNDYRAFRTRIKRPLTERASKRLVTRLGKLCNMHPDTAVAIVNRSVDKGWQDVYPLEDNAQHAIQQVIDQL